MQPLARVIDSPLLAEAVPHLAPETLHQLIRHYGLDACGEILMRSTPAQITAVLDLDLWRHAHPGRDEQFDVDRFGAWLEALVDAGDAIAARVVSTIDRPMVIAGLARYLRVFDPGTFEPTAASDDESRDRHEMMNSETGSGTLECEIGGYLVRARRTDAWDALVALLVTLDTDHNHDFHALMQGCRRLSNSRPEIDGLDDLLMAPEQHLHDVAVEREQRRSRRGFATSADARTFLEMARRPRHSSHAATAGTDFLAARQADRRNNTPHVSVDDEGHASTPVDDIAELLAVAGLTTDRPHALLEAAADPSRSGRFPLLSRLMAFTLRHDETAYDMRSHELAFLANTLMAGCSVQSRPFTIREASDAAASVCNLGLECWPSPRPATTPRGAAASRGHAATVPDTFLVNHDLVAVFEAGWTTLYHDVSLFVADRLVSILAGLHCVDADTRRGLHTLQRRLATHGEAGTPWLAREAADVLATLDMPAWISVLGLLDECPVLPAALTAVLERRTTSVSATAFQFISTTAQIGDIRVFMRALPGLLSS